LNNKKKKNIYIYIYIYINLNLYIHIYININYTTKRYKKAIDYFEKTLACIESVNSNLSNWEVTLCNLGHAYRKIRY